MFLTFSHQNPQIHNRYFNPLDIHLRPSDVVQGNEPIPNGYVKVYIDNNASNLVKRLSYRMQLVPRYVQEDMYRRIEQALEEEQLTDGMYFAL